MYEMLSTMFRLFEKNLGSQKKHADDANYCRQKTEKKVN